MADRTELTARLEFKKAALEKARAAYLDLLDGNVASYTIDGRSLTRLDLDKLKNHIKSLENEIDGLENMLKGGKPRKAIGIVQRDW